MTLRANLRYLEQPVATGYIIQGESLLWILLTTFFCGGFYPVHFRHEAQRGSPKCPGSHSQQVAELRFEP